MPDPLRIATVPYLNGRPLVHGLAERDDVTLSAAPPSHLGDLLRRGEADAALLPSIEYFRLAAGGGERLRGRAPAGFVALPVAAIGSRGPVGPSGCSATRSRNGSGGCGWIPRAAPPTSWPVCCWPGR